MSSNSKSVLPENVDLSRNSKEFNQDLQHQPETLSPKVDTVKIKAIENRNIDNDCPPTSENSIL